MQSATRGSVLRLESTTCSDLLKAMGPLEADPSRSQELLPTYTRFLACDARHYSSRDLVFRIFTCVIAAMVYAWRTRVGGRSAEARPVIRLVEQLP